MLQRIRSKSIVQTTNARSLLRYSSNSVEKKKIKINKSEPSLADFIKQSIGHSPSYDSTDASQMNLPSNYEKPQQVNNSFFIETYGCQMNSSDSEIVRSILLDNGYNASATVEDADVIFLNTCAIRENAEAKVWSRLDMLRSHKRKIKRRNHKLERKRTPPTVGVLGCMAERLKTKLLESDKMVDLVAGPDSYRDLPNLLDVIRSGHEENAVNVQLSLDETYADIAPVRSNPDSKSAYVSIMRGCNNMCSYCIVPFTRGRERSRDIQSIVDEVKRLRDEEVKEIVLLGQNVNSYHDKSTEKAKENGRGYLSAAGFNNMYKLRDGSGHRFFDLLDAVANVDEEIRVRFTSPHPKDFPDDVLDLVRTTQNICNSIHMPAQSGNTEVLKRMRRGYSREAYLSLAENIRNRIPGVSISSDFITGFCGETEEEHAETVSLMERVCYDQAFMFAYSMRARTNAAHKLVDNVPEDIKLRRLQEIIATFDRMVVKKNEVEEFGRLHVILVEGASKRSDVELTGLTDTNKRCVFPDVQVPGSLKDCRSTSHNDFLLNGNFSSPLVTLRKGDYVLVRIVETGRHTLKATPIARTSLNEVKTHVPQDILGARVHDYATLVEKK